MKCSAEDTPQTPILGLGAWGGLYEKVDNPVPLSVTTASPWSPVWVEKPPQAPSVPEVPVSAVAEQGSASELHSPALSRLLNAVAV